MSAVLAFVIRQYFPKRYSHFSFSSELHYNNLGWSEFYHVACPTATVMPGEIHYEGENGWEWNLLYRHSAGGKFYYGTIIVIFWEENTRGGDVKATLIFCSMFFFSSILRFQFLLRY